MSRFKYFDIFGRELHEPAVTPCEPTRAPAEPKGLRNAEEYMRDEIERYRKTGWIESPTRAVHFDAVLEGLQKLRSALATSDSRARAAEKAIAFIRQMLGLPVEQNGDDLLQRLSLLRRAEAEAAALRKGIQEAIETAKKGEPWQALNDLARLSALPVEKEEKNG